MAKIRAEWASEHEKISNIGPSDAGGGDTIAMVVKFGYDNHGI